VNHNELDRSQTICTDVNSDCNPNSGISESFDILNYDVVSHRGNYGSMAMDSSLSKVKSHSMDQPNRIEDGMTEMESPSSTQSHGMHLIADDMTEVTQLTDAPISSAWKFKSEFLGMELEGEEALKLAQELHLALKASLKGSEPPKISPTSRLLEPTEAFRMSGYNKPAAVKIDPREQGWVAVKTKPSATVNFTPPLAEENDTSKIHWCIPTCAMARLFL